MVAALSPVLEREFAAMGTEVKLVAPSGPAVAHRLALAERWLRAYEQRLSRFIPYSELSRLNASDGAPFRASPLLFDFLRLCLDLAHRSSGLFDPALLHEVVAAGYDRTFDAIGLARQARPAPAAATFRAIRLYRAARTIELPPGLPRK